MDALEKALFSNQVRTCAADLRQGGNIALGRLYDLTAARLLRYAAALTGNRHDAEDALQAGMVRIALHSQSLIDAWHPWAYLLKVVRNESVNIARRRALVRLFTPRELPTESEAGQSGDVEEFETRQLVQAALRKLPRTQSEVIVLKIWEEMTFDEIGEVLGVSLNTAASRYRYALEKLTQHLQPLASEVPHDE